MVYDSLDIKYKIRMGVNIYILFVSNLGIDV